MEDRHWSTLFYATGNSIADEDLIRAKKMAIESAQNNLDQQKVWLDTLPLRSGKKIVDIGCGPGLHLEYFKSRGLNPIGVDRWREGFLFHNEMEFYDSIDSIPDCSVDYIFCSHVLEHCRSPFVALDGWRRKLKETGLLVIIVPGYNDDVANDHWITGWNVGQLAMSLVASGLDCSLSTFMQIGPHVCGYGIKSDFPETRFNIKSSLPYLPNGLKTTLHFVGGNDLLNGKLMLANTEISRGFSQFSRKIVAQDKSARVHYLDFLSPMLALSDTWKDLMVSFSGGLDISNCTFTLILSIENGTEDLTQVRLAFLSSPIDKRNVLERWFALERGIVVEDFGVDDLCVLSGAPDLQRINSLYFGGIGTSTIKIILIINYEAGQKQIVKDWHVD